MLQEALMEFAKLSFDKEKIKDTAVNSVLSIEANKHHGREVDPSTMPLSKAETDLSRKYSDVSNKYNEILEVVTASHQGIGSLMAEIATFKADVEQFITSSSFRIERLEEFNLTSNQIESYNSQKEKGE